MGLSVALAQPLSAALDEASVLVIPGWNGSGVGHWQTLWGQKYRRFHRVIQHNWTRSSRADWIAQIDAAWRWRTGLRRPAKQPTGLEALCFLVAPPWLTDGDRVRRR
jgi:hypothetical protein